MDDLRNRWTARVHRSTELMIRPFRVSLIQCRGRAYDVGCAQARLFAATSKGRAFLRRKKIRFPWWFKIHSEEQLFTKYSPALWEEINGLADGLGMPLERAVLVVRQRRASSSAWCLFGHHDGWRLWR